MGTYTDKLYERQLSSTEQNTVLASADREVSVNIRGIPKVIKTLAGLPAEWNHFGTVANPALPGPAIAGLSVEDTIIVINGLAQEANLPRVRGFLGLTNTQKGYLAKAKSVVTQLKKKAGSAKLQEIYLSNLAAVIVSMKGAQETVSHFTSCLEADKELVKSQYQNDLQKYITDLIANKGVPLTTNIASQEQPVVDNQSGVNNSVEPEITSASIDDALNTVNNQANKPSIIQTSFDKLKAFFSTLKNRTSNKLISTIYKTLLDGQTFNIDSANKICPMLVKYMRVHPADNNQDDKDVYTAYKQRFQNWWTNNSVKYIEAKSNSHYNILFNERSGKTSDHFKGLILDILKIYPNANAKDVKTAIDRAFDTIIKDNGNKYYRNIQY